MLVARGEGDEGGPSRVREKLPHEPAVRFTRGSSHGCPERAAVAAGYAPRHMIRGR